MKCSAILSDCRLYRYVLTRVWDDSKSFVLFIGLNPSTADENENDPTINRCIDYAKRWGYGGLKMANLFAFRATLPKDLKLAKNPIGNENNKYIKQLSNDAELVVVAWGNDGNYLNRYHEVLNLLKSPMCLKINKSGQPAHPLYQAKNITLIEYNL